MVGCREHQKIESGFYLLKSVHDPLIENGLFLNVTNDSIKIEKYGSIFLSLDYKSILTASLNEINTDIDSVTYFIERQNSSDRHDLLIIKEPSRVLNFEMIKVMTDVPMSSNLSELLKDRVFKLSNDTSIRVHFLKKNRIVYKASDHNPDFQSWYSTDWIDSNSFILDGMHREFIQIKNCDSILCLYSPFQDRIVANEIKSSYKRSLSLNLDDIDGTWVRLNPNYVREDLPFKVKPRTVTFKEGKLFLSRDTIYYFVDAQTGFLDLQHLGGRTLIELADNKLKLIRGDLYRNVLPSKDTVVYIKN